jgi:hypothetical protein
MEDRLLSADPGKKYVSQVSSQVMSAKVTTTFNQKEQAK